MDSDGAELIVKWYLEIEQRLFSILKTVPLSTDTEGVFLPSLSSIILESCSLIDTIFRDGYKPVAQAQNANMPMYARYYEGIYELSSARTVIYNYPIQSLCPFENWMSPNGDYIPILWWQNYNKLKHDRIQHFPLSTFRTAIDSLCALHQILAYTPALIDALTRHNLLCTLGINPAIITAWLKGEEEYDERYQALIETELFATPRGSLTFPENLQNANVRIYDMNHKFWKYVGFNNY
ncbi:hypothetical protein [Gimesia maris]|uniref:Uncharacterized protein n=1 Tax=Gimesia maris TaxID=122 RepID=A0ABX5YIP7_9PLAN|nr:hypothetical protein [Gimesia maris]EDL58261.1 hypothetical protein PM8797T_17037 [Gimesia maris DSM 8797]QEG15533.1 hypothetical protein GmarT_13740 [Gimesia maris]QGQ31169.1 hypothetical protein F1729_22425 [Gimesia maris]